MTYWVGKKASLKKPFWHGDKFLKYKINVSSDSILFNLSYNSLYIRNIFLKWAFTISEQLEGALMAISFLKVSVHHFRTIGGCLDGHYSFHYWTSFLFLNLSDSQKTPSRNSDYFTFICISAFLKIVLKFQAQWTN